MSTSTLYQNLKLQTADDYKFFAALIGQKLRNTNFKPKWREQFMKTLLQQMIPITSINSLSKIGVIIQDIGRQKNEQQKEAKRLADEKSNIKDKGLVGLKPVKDHFGKGGKIIQDQQGDFISDSQEQDD